MDFSEQLKSLRRKANLTQGNIAEICKVSRQAVAKWESNECLPDIQKIVILSDYFKMSIEELLDGKAREKEEEQISDAAYLEKLINQGLGEAMDHEDPDDEINCFIEFLGRQMGTDRFYIYEKDTYTNVYEPTYQWCREGYEPHINYIDASLEKNHWAWAKRWKRDKCIFINNIEKIKNTQHVYYEWLKSNNIRSVVILPLLRKGSFIGVDNPPGAFLSETGDVLSLVAHFVESMLRNRDLVASLRMEHEQRANIDDASHTACYYIDMITGKVSFNKPVKDIFETDVRLENLEDMNNFLSCHGSSFDTVINGGIEKIRETGQNYILEFAVVTNEGETRWKHATVCSYFDKNGRLLQIYGVIEDMTPKYGMLLALSKDYISVFLLNLKTDTLYVVKRTGTIGGKNDDNFFNFVTYSNIVQEYLNEKIHPDDREMFVRAASVENVIQKLSKNSEYSILFRIVGDEKHEKCMAIYSRLDSGNADNGTNILLAFKYAD